MRLLVLGVALLITTTAAAQSRWIASAGPQWNPLTNQIAGLLRAEYDVLRPDRPLRLRLEAGGLWGPTQDFTVAYRLLDQTVQGESQFADLRVGIAASYTPLPHVRIAPYFTFGYVARQVWGHGWSSIVNRDGSTAAFTPEHSATRGYVNPAAGFGIRARLGQRQFQLEIRRMSNFNSLTLGTTLPF